MLDVSSQVASRRPGHRSNMQTLAKAQVRNKRLVNTAHAAVCIHVMPSG